MPAKQTLYKHGVTGKTVSTRNRSGDPGCSSAASKLALRQVDHATAVKLAACRAAAKGGKQAEAHRAAGNVAKAQVIEHRIKSGAPVGPKDRAAKLKEILAKRKTVKAEPTTGKPVAPSVAAAFSLKQESAVGRKAPAPLPMSDVGTGRQGTLLDVKKGDLPGQTSLLEQVPSVEVGKPIAPSTPSGRPNLLASPLNPKPEPGTLPAPGDKVMPGKTPVPKAPTVKAKAAPREHTGPMADLGTVDQAKVDKFHRNYQELIDGAGGRGLSSHMAEHFRQRARAELNPSEAKALSGKIMGGQGPRGFDKDAHLDAIHGTMEGKIGPGTIKDAERRGYQAIPRAEVSPVGEKPRPVAPSVPANSGTNAPISGTNPAISGAIPVSTVSGRTRDEHIAHELGKSKASSARAVQHVEQKIAAHVAGTNRPVPTGMTPHGVLAGSSILSPREKGLIAEHKAAVTKHGANDAAEREAHGRAFDLMAKHEARPVAPSSPVAKAEPAPPEPRVSGRTRSEHIARHLAESKAARDALPAHKKRDVGREFDVKAEADLHGKRFDAAAKRAATAAENRVSKSSPLVGTVAKSPEPAKPFDQSAFTADFHRAFDAARGSADNHVKLHDLRKALPQHSREHFDKGLDAIRGFNDDGSPRPYSLGAHEGNRAINPAMSTEERASGIREGDTLLSHVSRRSTPKPEIPVSKTQEGARPGPIKLDPAYVGMGNLVARASTAKPVAPADPKIAKIANLWRKAGVALTAPDQSHAAHDQTRKIHVKLQKMLTAKPAPYTGPPPSYLAKPHVRRSR
jgi:hypothetical protein